jgi:outer membrane protein assembly factor BamB
MFGNGPEHTQRGLFPGPQVRGGLLWKHLLTSLVFTPPAIGKAGVVFSADRANGIVAFDGVSGNILWTYNTDSPIDFSATITPQGTVIATSLTTVYAFTQSGTLVWSYGGLTNVLGYITSDVVGNIYILSDNGNLLHSFTPSGTLRWTYTIPNSSAAQSYPTVDINGNVFFGTQDGTVYALNNTGALVWSYVVGNVISSTTALGTDGTVYFTSQNSSIYALTPTGTLKWSFATTASISSSPSIGIDGTVYIGSNDGILYSLDPMGNLKWSYNSGSPIFSSQIIDSKNTVYFANGARTLYALNGDSGSVLWTFGLDSIAYGPPSIGCGGILYIVTVAGTLYAIRDV